MKRLWVILLISSSLFISLHAKGMPMLAKELSLQAGTKATVQWERIFSSQRHLTRYKLDSIPKHTRNQLKAYLIKHAADSEQPIVPGL